MAFELKSVVPWGRSYEEYIDMFELTEGDLSKRILGCGDGPAGFNARLTQNGGTIASVDPLYTCSADEIRRRIDETFDEVIHQVRTNQGDFVWDRIPDIDALGHIRMAAMHEFLDDYDSGKAEGRYLPQALPKLDFADHAFDLALSSHFLFLYSKQLDLDFHIRAITELCRVAAEVRIFPLLQLGTEPSPHVEPVCGYFQSVGLVVELEQVAYEFQRGGNRMLKIKR